MLRGFSQSIFRLSLDNLTQTVGSDSHGSVRQHYTLMEALDVLESPKVNKTLRLKLGTRPEVYITKKTLLGQRSKDERNQQVPQ